MSNKLSVSIVIVALAAIPVPSIAQVVHGLATVPSLASHLAPCQKPDVAATPLAESVTGVANADMTATTVPPQGTKATYVSGLLTVRTEGATLAQVLEAIQTATGAEFEAIPEQQDCVMANLSGSPRRVIFDLLNGSGFGYIIIATPQDPEGLQRVILSKLAPLEGSHNARIAQAPVRESIAVPTTMQVRKPDPVGDDEGINAVSNRSAKSDPDVQSQTTLALRDTMNAAAETPQDTAATQPQQQGTPASRLLGELYRLRQQQTQQQLPKAAIPDPPPQ